MPPPFPDIKKGTADDLVSTVPFLVSDSFFLLTENLLSYILTPQRAVLVSKHAALDRYIVRFYCSHLDNPSKSHQKDKDYLCSILRILLC